MYLICMNVCVCICKYVCVCVYLSVCVCMYVCVWWWGDEVFIKCTQSPNLRNVYGKLLVYCTLNRDV